MNNPTTGTTITTMNRRCSMNESNTKLTRLETMYVLLGRARLNKRGNYSICQSGLVVRVDSVARIQ